MDAGVDAATQILPPIPGQDPALVTANGPPYITLSPDQLKVMGNTALAVDGLGNIIVAISNRSGVTLTKLGPQLSQVWQRQITTLTLFNIGLPDLGLAADAAGNIYVGGTTRNGSTLTQQGALAQVLPDGTPGWVKSFGPTNSGSEVFAVGVDSGGSVYALGKSDGQFPNEPAASSGHGFELKFAPDGTQLLQAQPVGLKSVPTALVLDTAGESFTIDGVYTTKLDATLQPVWSSQPGPLAIGVTPNGMGLYESSPVDRNTGAIGIVRRDPTTGLAIWQRSLGTQMATINAVEGEVWNGKFPQQAVPAMVVSTDAVYIAGSYMNSYMHGSSPPPNSQPCFVARLDLQGNQVWFQQFRYKYSAASPEADFRPFSMALAPGGMLVVNTQQGVLVLNQANGALATP